MNAKQTFGETVKILRESNNLTLREVSNNLDIDTSMLGKIEKNNRRPSLQLIEKFATYFNVNIKDLKIAFLSDSLVYQVKDEELASEVLKLAERKVKYLKKKSLLNK
jgi:transcriptional regulator with XRE-family HTH domain